MNTSLVKLLKYSVNWVLAYYLVWTFFPPFFGDAYGYTQQMALPFVDKVSADPNQYEAEWLLRAKYHSPYWMWAVLFVLSGTVGKEWLKSKFEWMAGVGFWGSAALSLVLQLMLLLLTDQFTGGEIWQSPAWLMHFDLVLQGPGSVGIFLSLSLFGEVWDWVNRAWGRSRFNASGAQD